MGIISHMRAANYGPSRQRTVRMRTGPFSHAHGNSPPGPENWIVHWGRAAAPARLLRRGTVCALRRVRARANTQPARMHLL